MKVKSANRLENGQKERVYKEYGMTKEGIAEDVQTIKTWLLKQPHLPHIRNEELPIQVDEWLENYLISCKNSVERVKEGLDLYFTSRVLIPEVFQHRDPLSPQIQQSFSVMHICSVPGLSNDGHKVFIFSHTRPTGDDFEPVAMLKRLSMMIDIHLLEGVDFLGLEVIVDYKNVCFSQLARYNPILTKKCADFGLKGIPQRVRRIHFVNPTSAVEYSKNIFKHIISKKLQDRILIHKDTSDMVKALGADAVPKDFGGSAPTVEQLSCSWEKKLISYREWFLASENIKTDESKRVGKCRYENPETFGHQGSFRKIEVD